MLAFNDRTTLGTSGGHWVKFIVSSVSAVSSAAAANRVSLKKGRRGGEACWLGREREISARPSDGGRRRARGGLEAGRAG